jgi:3-deoxy-D-manno-octulosonate 8-phosphate phosphatase (KDO 8-P phosphatase)
MSGPAAAPAIGAEQARRVRLVGIDVDGVMTDGGIYLGAAGGTSFEFKRYDIHDGLGIHFMREAGIKVVVITGRVSDSVRLRAAELEVDELVQDARVRKLPAFHRSLQRFGVRPEEAAFVGDDFPDLAVLRMVGLPVAVANAVPEVRDACALRLSRAGGRGAIRELAELLLKARGQWEEVTERYVRSRLTDEDVA